MSKTPMEYEVEIALLKQSLADCLKAIDDAGAVAKKRIADLERSANSAREIARDAMTHTGTRAMRVEMFNSDTGIQIIVCDPAGDESATTMRMAKMLDAALWARIGIGFKDETPTAVGATG